MTSIGCCPSTRSFAISCIRVKIPQSDVVASRFVCHIPNFYILMKNRNTTLWNWIEFVVKQSASNIMHGICEVVQLQVLLNLFRVEVIFCTTYLFSIKTIIPRFNGNVITILVCDGLHIGYLLIYTSNGCWPYSFHQL